MNDTAQAVAGLLPHQQSADLTSTRQRRTPSPAAIIDACLPPVHELVSTSLPANHCYRIANYASAEPAAVQRSTWITCGEHPPVACQTPTPAPISGELQEASRIRQACSFSGCIITHR